MPQRLRFQALAFLGSFLAFCLELAAAKLLLPRFGGSAYVWTGAMMFFQAMLLAAYLYGRRARLHPRAHAVAILLPFFFLPLALPAGLADAAPYAELFRALLLSVGAPFFMLSTTVVVAQSWLMRSSCPEREDGYFLFAASNAGAACALFAYPLAVEPLLSVIAQGWLWRGLYAAYAALCLSCAPWGPVPAHSTSGLAPSPRQRTQWLLLSAAPCAALLAATNLLSLDFAAVPLLWTAPLATYLLTFVLNFKREPWYPERLNRAMLPAVAFWLALCLLPFVFAFWFSQDSTPAQIFGRALDVGKFGYMLFALFALCMIFHRSLAVARPSSERAMAEYYSWIAAGGLFGSVLVALVVPYLGRGVGAVALDWAAVTLLAVAAILTRDWEQVRAHRKTAAALGLLAAAVAVAIGSAGSRAGAGYSLRNFYGVYSVRDEHGTRVLFHGNTEHGMQFLDPSRQDEPLSYYGFRSPLGDAWQALGAGWTSVGVVGLGAGSIAAYGRAGMTLDFYELDPDVAVIAGRSFTYLSRSASTVRVVTGDGRLSLERAEGAAYDGLILDAFSSGSIPIHLLTKEAFTSYLARLRPGGVILVHISNRYLDLRPVLGAAARDLGLSAASKRQLSPGVPGGGIVPSVWVAVSRDAAAISTLVEKRGWRALGEGPSRASAWTDQHASLLPALVL
ncbi:MAG: fused MFS/spermidine synthase [Elusimicrobiota bacterium]|nr:fused MFS/spermidine synthase [Elusimicrobiota bacterium]